MQRYTFISKLVLSPTPIIYKANGFYFRELLSELFYVLDLVCSHLERRAYNDGAVYVQNFTVY